MNLQKEILEAYNKLEHLGFKARSSYELECEPFLLRFYIVDGDYDVPTDSLEIHFTTHSDPDVK